MSLLEQKNKPAHQHFSILGSGNRPLVVHIPHSALNVDVEYPDWCVGEEQLAQEQHLLVDWATDRLFEPCLAREAWGLRNDLSRLVFDPERYADEDQEEMSRVGMWVFYTHGARGTRIKSDLSDVQKESLLQKLYWPYHQALTDLIAIQLERFGHTLLIDGHSYYPIELPYEVHAGTRHELCIGTAGIHTPEWLKELACACFEGYDVGFDAPFAGSFVPSLFQGDPRVMSMMLEVRRDLYLHQEGDDAPRWASEKAALFQQRLDQFLERVLLRLS